MRKLKHRNVKCLTRGPAAEATLSVTPTSGWLQKPQCSITFLFCPLRSVFCLLVPLFLIKEASEVEAQVHGHLAGQQNRSQDAGMLSPPHTSPAGQRLPGSNSRPCPSPPDMLVFPGSDQNLSCFNSCPSSFADFSSFSSLCDSLAYESMSPPSCHSPRPCLSPSVHFSTSP